LRQYVVLLTPEKQVEHLEQIEPLLSRVVGELAHVDLLALVKSPPGTPP
jgi:hypothetical protein